jgi:F-type H+-transporting ATPase subunit gamma
MGSAREIRSKIKSVKSIQKITLAMQMVSASKMRRAQERMFASRPYANKILDIISNLATADPQYRHPYMVVRKINRVGMIVITSDRGLCGALNINTLRMAVSELKQWSLGNIEQDLCLIGNKAEIFFRRYGGNVVVKASHLGDSSSGLHEIIGAVKVMLDAYLSEHIDALYVCFNEFVNTMTQRPKVQQLLPISSQNIEKPKHHWDYLYEPNAKTLLNLLLKRYIETQVYQSAVENIACEYAARMVAMKSATDNAHQLIDHFQLAYNKARQASITNEISEIVSGAEAIK